MPYCLIIGDSIALGVAMALASSNMAGCDVKARVSATSRLISSFVEARKYDAAIISAGSNDAANADLRSDLWQLRQRVRARHVTWIYPRRASAAWAVHDVAARFNDRTVGMNRLPSRDGIHPASYRTLIPLLFRPARRHP